MSIDVFTALNMAAKAWKEQRPDYYPLKEGDAAIVVFDNATLTIRNNGQEMENNLYGVCPVFINETIDVYE